MKFYVLIQTMKVYSQFKFICSRSRLSHDYDGLSTYRFAIAKLFPFTFRPKTYIPARIYTYTTKQPYNTLHFTHTYLHFCGLNFGIIIYFEFSMSLNEKFTIERKMLILNHKKNKNKRIHTKSNENVVESRNKI